MESVETQERSTWTEKDVEDAFGSSRRLRVNEDGDECGTRGGQGRSAAELRGCSYAVAVCLLCAVLLAFGCMVWGLVVAQTPRVAPPKGEAVEVRQ